MFGKWYVKLPEKPTHINCLVTMQPNSDKYPRYVTMGWVDERQIMPGGVAWMPLPKHIIDDPEGWYSPYREDSYPSKNGWYLVCFEKSKWLIKKLYYDTKQSSFLGVPNKYGDIIAWRSLPKPYTGLGWPKE